jgi:hypothetical protein
MATFKLTKNDIKNIYRRCLTLVRSKPPEFFILRKLKGVHGLCNWTDLEFDSRGEILATAYHECIHYIYPTWSETKVMYAESRVINNVTLFDNARFLKAITDKFYKAALYNNLSLKRKKLRRKKKNETRNPRR